MPLNKTRYWTVPLTILLFVNTVLVAWAARQVGSGGDLAAVLPESVPAAQPAQPTSSEPTSSEPVAPPAVRTNEKQADDPQWATDDAMTEDWLAAGEQGDITSGPGEQATIEPADGRPAGGAPAPTQQPEIPRDILIVINPPATGGVVHFLLDGEVVSLAPGELARVLAKNPRLVQFHRGDDFGDEELRTETGVFCFAVGDRGWMLSEAEDHEAMRLLQVCRPVQPVMAGQAGPGDEEDS